MRFALLGNHPDGLEMSCALVESGRHHLVAYTGPTVPANYLQRWGPNVKRVSDLEEVLADPAVDAVIVAGGLAVRPEQLRRALQSERHVLCVYPAAESLDVPYEAALLQADSGRVLLPLLPAALHPAVGRLAALAGGQAGSAKQGLLGEVRLVELTCWSAQEVLLGEANEAGQLALPGWDVLRALRGEVAELAAVAAGEELAAGVPLLLAGRFERGGLLQVALLPGQPEPCWRLAVVGTHGRAELLLPLGWPGPAYLCWQAEAGEFREEAWPIWDPWPPLVQVFEEQVSRSDAPLQRTPPTWQDAVRGQELDDAVRRSLRYRRVSTLEYPEASEEVGFKGTMTLVGCALVWIILLLAILSAWVPWLGWGIGPVLGVFLILQMLRWIVPRPPGRTKA
jgi:predicted dehydrogenase